MNLRQSLIVLSAVALIFLIAACGSEADQTETVGDVVATVNGEEITKEQFDTAFEQTKLAYQQQGINIEDDENVLEEAKMMTVNELVQESVLHQEFEKRGYEARQAQIEEMVEEVKSQFGSDEEFEEVLNMNQMTLEDLEEQIVLQIKFEKLIEQEFQTITVSEDEARDYYSMLQEQNEEFDEPFEDVRADIESFLKEQKTGEKLQQLVEELMDNSEIEILI